MSPQGDTPMATLYVTGDVSLAAAVDIAPGAILQAAPGSRLVIADQTRIATGVVIQAHGGDLYVGAGCTLETGVLVIGAGTIGDRATIGAESTLLNPQVAPAEVIETSALIGDKSRLGSTVCPIPEPETVPTTAPASDPTAPAVAAENLDPAETPASDQPDSAPIATHTVVYGQEQVTRLIQTLFPHRRPLDSSPASNSDPKF